MKKIVYLFFIIAVMSCNSDDDSSNTVFSGDIEITDQQSLDALAAKKFTRINGSLKIYGSVSNLDGLETITEVTGELILQTGMIDDINGLQNLSKAGSLVIGGTALTNLNALNALTTVGVLNISGNQLLVSISGLKNLTAATEIGISWNPKLSSLTGLEGITAVDNLSLGGNHLTDLAGLDNLASATAITITEDIESLNGLGNLAQAGYVQIQGTQLVNLQGLQGLHKVEDFALTDNQELTSLQGLENLTEANAIKLAGDLKLTSISALSNLTTLGHSLSTGGLFIDMCFAMPTLDGVQNVSHFKGSVIVKATETLKDFCALQNILANGDLNTVTITRYNADAPTADDIVAGNCIVE
jgi:hypothetical protein